MSYGLLSKSRVTVSIISARLRSRISNGYTTLGSGSGDFPRHRVEVTRRHNRFYGSAVSTRG